MSSYIQRLLGSSFHPSDHSEPSGRLEEFQIEISPPTPLHRRLQTHVSNAAGFLRRNSNGTYYVCLWIIFIPLVLEMMFFLFNYYESYQAVFPGSKVAANINKTSSSATAFEVFKWMICSFSLLITIPIAFALFAAAIKPIHKKFGILCAIPFGVVLFAIFGSLATWQFWITWVVTPVWTDHVFDNACNNWDVAAVLQGVSWKSLPQALPYVGSATVVLKHANYSMQLERNEVDHNFYTFYILETHGYVPPFGNITYDIGNLTYTIDNVTTHFQTDPALVIPSLNISTVDPSIQFNNNWGPPAANLVFENHLTRTSVLNTVTTSSDCTKLRVCGMLEPTGDFQITMGVVLISQYLYSVSCTEPSSSN